MQAKKAGCIAIENVLTAFLPKVQNGPAFVCTSCQLSYDV